MVAKTQVQVEGVTLTLSNLEKVLYPAAGFTKADVIHYYHEIAPLILPHLADRPLTMKRYPDGVGGEYFYEKQCPDHRPDWVETAAIVTDEKHGAVDYCVVAGLAALTWVANLASLELHTLLSRAQDPTQPTVLVFDLDPGPPADILSSARAAIWLREVLGHLRLESFAKTSGGKGLHLYVPLNTPATFAQTKRVAHTLARLLEKQHPQEITSNMRKDLRTGKVFVDWGQNEDFKTTVCAYSLRARERPAVSTPVSWDEVEAAVKRSDRSRLQFEADDVMKRAQKLGDLFAPVLALQQKLPDLDSLDGS